MLLEINLVQRHQYSLYSVPNVEYYRILVKKKAGNPLHPDGLLSNYLHHAVRESDAVELSPPTGEFTLASEE